MPQRSKKRETQTEATKMERTGVRTFNIKHDDGSVFECQVDDPRRFNGLKGSSGRSKVISMGGIGERKPLICDKCKKQVHRIRFANGQSVCTRCS